MATQVSDKLRRMKPQPLKCISVKMRARLGDFLPFL